MNPTTSLEVSLPPRPRIGAWTSRPSASRIAVAVALGLDELHLMVHDDAADRRANAFAMDADIRESCKRIVDAGIELHLTAWAEPHAEYLAAACHEMAVLASDFGARSVCWDAEEPWTKAVGGLTPEKAAMLINLHGLPEGVTAIGYASREVDPLVTRASYVAPQAYVTAKPGGLDVGGVAAVIARWRGRAPHAEMVPAFAAYDQPVGGIAQCWVAAGKPRRVLLWSLRHIENHPNEVKRLRAAMENEA